MEILSTKQVAERMGVTQRVVTYWCASGFFKSATKVGRDWAILANDLRGFAPPKRGPKKGKRGKPPTPTRDGGAGEKGREASDGTG